MLHLWSELNEDKRQNLQIKHSSPSVRPVSTTLDSHSFVFCFFCLPMRHAAPTYITSTSWSRFHPKRRTGSGMCGMRSMQRRWARPVLRHRHGLRAGGRHDWGTHTWHTVLPLSSMHQKGIAVVWQLQPCTALRYQ